MSSESIYHKGKSMKSRCQTQRKIAKNESLSVKTNKKKNRIKQQPKSLSVRFSAAKQKYCEKNKENERKSANVLILVEKQTKNEKTKVKADFYTNQTQKYRQITDLALIKLKVKNKKQISEPQNKLTKIKQKTCFKIQQQECKLSKRNKKPNQTQKNTGSKQKTNSNCLHLESTNFQHNKITGSIESLKTKENRKRIPSLKFFYKNLKGQQNQGLQKRKKIHSCKFVVNPFNQIKYRFDKQFNSNKFLFKEDEKNYEQFTGQHVFNDISGIEHLMQTQQSCMDEICEQMMIIQKNK